ncbi:MAG: transporter [Rhizobiales bacterium]|nr:transporter [Hyphomicrobiales bacterium]
MADARGPSGEPGTAVPGLVWAFRIHPDGTAEELAVDAPLEDRHDGWLWLHFNLADQRAGLWLDSASGLPEPALALMRGADRHQQLHAADGCIYGVVADLVRDLSRVTHQIGHLRFAMTERRMITARHEALHATELARQKLRRGHRLKNVAALLDVVIDHVADAIDTLVDDIGSQLDAIEDRVLTRRTSDERAELGRLRRLTVRLHRQLLGLRSLFHRLERDGVAALPQALQLQHAHLVQRLDGLDHEVVAMRERARLLQDEVSAKLVAETNRNLDTLTILGALFLPPTLISGIFGMNTKDLPLAETNHGSLWALGLMALSSAAVYGLFRWISRRR